MSWTISAASRLLHEDSRNSKRFETDTKLELVGGGTVNSDKVWSRSA
jgi:hypothetical protein